MFFKKLLQQLHTRYKTKQNKGELLCTDTFPIQIIIKSLFPQLRHEIAYLPSVFTILQKFLLLFFFVYNLLIYFISLKSFMKTFKASGPFCYGDLQKGKFRPLTPCRTTDQRIFALLSQVVIQVFKMQKQNITLYLQHFYLK